MAVGGKAGKAKKGQTRRKSGKYPKVYWHKGRIVEYGSVVKNQRWHQSTRAAERAVVRLEARGIPARVLPRTQRPFIPKARTPHYR